ncbi:MAG: riboflavin synthase [Candidatus Aminicenantes bacterium]|jgi:riboflavin synthase
MFTGIISDLGFFKGYSLGKKAMAIVSPGVAPKLGLGDSLAVNGVCLSLIKRGKNTLSFNLSEETLRRTTLGSCRPGDRLNLELPVTLATRLSGHLVTGHTDSKGKILKISPSGEDRRITFSLPEEIKPYCVIKGSVAVNGVSLTITDLTPTSFDVELVPITLENTNLGILKRGDEVNIESDLIGKYVYNWWVKERHRK